MPNIKSAKKRVKVNSVKAANNKALKTALKTMYKKADAAVEDKEAVIRATIKKVDQAAAKGIMHKNAASRKKAQLAKKLNAAKA